jgi:hypothetical protein
MAGVLWQRESFKAAVALENLWNALLRDVPFELYCGYPIDLFGEDFNVHRVGEILETHTHLLPAPNSADLGRVFDRAMDDVLGEQARDVRARFAARARRDGPAIPKPEQNILWLRSNLPEHATAILERARALYEDATVRLYLRQDHSRL